MAQILNLPVRFQFLRIPTAWQLITAGGQDVLVGQIDLDAKVAELDGWQCQKEFFNLPKNNRALYDFLAKVGAYQLSQGKGELLPYRHRRSSEIYAVKGRPEALAPEEIWAFRDGLKESLADKRKRFKYLLDPVAWEGYSAITLMARYAIHYPFSVGLGLADRNPAAFMPITGLHDLLIVTAVADVMRGFHHRKCQRHDCPEFFTAERPDRRFCSQYCGHLESLRRTRRVRRQETTH